MSPRLMIIVATLLILAGAGLSTFAEQFSTVRVTYDNKEDFLKIKRMGLDFEHADIGPNYVDVLIPTVDIPSLEQAGLKYTVKISDMTKFYQGRFDMSKAVGSMGGYRTLSEVELVMDSIANEHPDIVKPKWSIGNTLEGRPLYVMKIANNPLVDEAEPEVYYYAATHCREVITPEILIYFMRYLTNNYNSNPQVKYLVDNRQLYFTPVVNPDGYLYNEVDEPGGGGLWRKNRRNNGNGTFGVDINRNYGAFWGYDNVGSSNVGSDETFRGTAAFSEPETQAMRDFIIAHHFSITISYHSYANLFLFPWGYADIYSADNDIFNAMGDSIKAITTFTYGPPWAVLYNVNGSSDDWGYAETTLKNKNYAVTEEVGGQSDGFWPPTARITPLVTPQVQTNLFYARIAANPEALRAPARPSIYTIGDLDTADFNLYWHHVDILNPAVSFEVRQMQNLTRVTDDVETNARWTESGFSLSTTHAHSGTKAYWGGATNSADTRVTMGEQVKVVTGDSLKFWVWYATENNWDYGYVEVSSDGGLNWASIPGNITTNSNPNGTNLGNGITGTSASFVQGKFSLAAFVGQDILVRFRYMTDQATLGAGIWIDDISPVEFYGTNTLLSNSVTDTTYLVTGLAAGHYSFRVRAKDAQNQLSAYSAVETTTVYFGPPPCTWLVGDANNDGTLNISDGVYLISFIFNGGAAPVPNVVGSGDADCNSTVNISDAVFLITYIFAGGSAPSCLCGAY